METGFDVTFCMKAHGCTITHDKENTQTSGCLEYNVAWLELTWENGVLVKKFFSNFTVVGDPGKGSSRFHCHCITCPFCISVPALSVSSALAQRGPRHPLVSFKIGGLQKIFSAVVSHAVSLSSILLSTAYIMENSLSIMSQYRLLHMQHVVRHIKKALKKGNHVHILICSRMI